jgi:hypothetical protein
MKRLLTTMVALATLIAAATSANAEMTQGKPDIKSAGPLAFSPDGVLFVGDPQGAAVFAIDAKDTAGNPNEAELNVEGIDGKVAAALGTTADDILINDMAVNPASGKVFLSVSRGRGPDAIPVLLTVDPKGQIAEFPLDNVSYAKAELPNPPEDRVVGEGRRRQNNRLESITDLLYLDGNLYIAGLSNEEFASNLRSIPFPFEDANEGASIEIFHGNHGQYETRSPVRTFTVVDIEDTPHLLAAYTCTPLVKIPLNMLKPGEKIRGDTIAELGNRNRPLDMIVYQKDGERFVLMANNARGVMKIPMEGVSDAEAITEPVEEEKAGVEYETLEGVEGVVQLDRLNYDNAVLLVESDSGVSLKTMALP